jgi:hypothetical protein
MDLRLTLALGLAGGFAVTAAPALTAKVADKIPRTRLGAQAPGEAPIDDSRNPGTISKLDRSGPRGAGGVA